MIGNDIVAITRQFLLLARNESHSGLDGILTGLPQDVLDRISKLDIGQIEALASEIRVSLFSMRISVEEIDKLLALSEKNRGAYALSLVTSPTRQQRSVAKQSHLMAG